MGNHYVFGGGFAKSQFAAGVDLTIGGAVFLSVNDHDKKVMLPLVKNLSELGIRLIATSGTAAYLKKHGFDVTPVNKVREGYLRLAEQFDNNFLIINAEEDLKQNLQRICTWLKVDNSK